MSPGLYAAAVGVPIVVGTAAIGAGWAIHAITARGHRGRRPRRPKPKGPYVAHAIRVWAAGAATYAAVVLALLGHVPGA